ncbi:hypothetical protein [Candidatus Macondimonas diazotrophica]|uniref:Uncharacterized protein n=1 Tax=Candidatus Macondimonas diazotrophica TaxID=2305248 RepID=A0A4Z0FB04_9GAMM|nr:hypothetical protein [Candidatus Macondimonas diazotrophica]TFZ83364.1 hypothetical protein E4680_04765 [Candidatus Macondimonas diazotrophica]
MIDCALVVMPVRRLDHYAAGHAVGREPFELPDARADLLLNGQAAVQIAVSSRGLARAPSKRWIAGAGSHRMIPAGTGSLR